MRRLAALLATLTMLVATGAASAPAQAQSPAGKYAQQAFTATNANRVNNGLKALKASDCLKRAAVRQAKAMAQQERIFHQDLGRVMKDCKLNTAGENVAYGYASGKSVVNDGWMKSEGHRANILNPSFKLMGIGARKGHDGRLVRRPGVRPRRGLSARNLLRTNRPAPHQTGHEDEHLWPGIVLAALSSATALASADAAPRHHAPRRPRQVPTRSPRPSTDRALQGSKVRIKGSVKPAAPGAKVTLQVRYADQKTWKNVATDTLSASSRFKFAGQGQQRPRAQVPRGQAGRPEPAARRTASPSRSLSSAGGTSTAFNPATDTWFTSRETQPSTAVSDTPSPCSLLPLRSNQQLHIDIQPEPGLQDFRRHGPASTTTRPGSTGPLECPWRPTASRGSPARTGSPSPQRRPSTSPGLPRLPSPRHR